MSDIYRLVLIDDNRSEQKFFSLLVRIKKLPIEVAGFPDPVSALAALEEIGEEDFPHAIVTDIKMPYMDGFEFADVFRERFHSKHPHTLLFIGSSTVLPADIERAEGHPQVSGFIQKPFDEDKIQQHILEKLKSAG